MSQKSRFGDLPPSDEELMGRFLEGGPFVFTGPPFWNALNLGATAMFACQLVYNTKRTGEFTFGSKRFVLRRVAFPRKPTPEWYVVDLLESHVSAGVSSEAIEARLAEALRGNRFDAQQLTRMAKRYGAITTQAIVRRASS